MAKIPEIWAIKKARQEVVKIAGEFAISESAESIHAYHERYPTLITMARRIEKTEEPPLSNMEQAIQKTLKNLEKGVILNVPVAIARNAICNYKDLKGIKDD